LSEKGRPDASLLYLWGNLDILDMVKRLYMARGARFLLGGLVIVVALGYLAFSAANTLVYSLSIGELKSDPKFIGERVRVGGLVNRDTVRWDARTMTLEFTLEQSVDQLPVVYEGVVPEAFDSASGVTLEGEYTKEGIFRAKSLLLQCPSKYEVATPE
jgi:cytochrome c-type biogenesis protein CcmE